MEKIDFLLAEVQRLRSECEGWRAENEKMQLSMKAARVNANLTQEEAAIAIGIGRSTLQSYEAGKCIPNIDVAKRMAKTYKLSVDNIIFLPNECA